MACCRGGVSAHLLSEAARRFDDAGIDTPLLDAQLLMAKALGTSRLDVMTHPERELEQSERDAFVAMAAKRAERYPLPYILGRKEFHGLELIVSPAVLIPRPETEVLVESVVERLSLTNVVIADVGTGSGAIAVALAVALPEARVIATDISRETLEVAGSNVQKHQVDGRVELTVGHLIEPLAASGLQFDAIVSNPPYIPTAEIESLQPEVRLYEPRAALDGGPDGLEAYRELIPAAMPILTDGGFLAVEVGAGQAEGVRNIAAMSGSQRTEAIRDLAGIERVVIAHG